MRSDNIPHPPPAPAAPHPQHTSQHSQALALPATHPHTGSQAPIVTISHCPSAGCQLWALLCVKGQKIHKDHNTSTYCQNVFFLDKMRPFFRKFLETFKYLPLGVHPTKSFSPTPSARKKNRKRVYMGSRPVLSFEFGGSGISERL